ncbi:DUF427 domain-containing protein [Sciscionella sediminilitoris]|uniref:DUF427 domain-containing protein n=1 Tax=Sciscionella sediminilitoris TaxID=1445613 RepID=UPI00056D7D93|nr:DUF427 domain-containing protein [Sciscionella sp. SE31]
MTIARLNGEVLAESSETLVLDGKHYFPRRSVRSGYFRPVRSDENGASHYAVTIDGNTTECAELYGKVPDPRLADHVLFSGPVEIED